MKSHANYVKLLFGTLIHAITTRTQRPETPTLFILDETGSLGTFPYLSSMISLGRGMGMTCCTFWQDLSQIQAHYFDWQSIVNNSTLQIFGVGSFMAAKTLQELTGVSATTILNMKPEHQLIVQDGHVQNAYKVNYLTDSIFSGKYEPNPLHQEDAKSLAKKVFFFELLIKIPIINEPKKQKQMAKLSLAGIVAKGARKQNLYWRFHERASYYSSVRRRKLNQL